MEECKIPAWARDKMFRHQQATFSFLPVGTLTPAAVHLEDVAIVDSN